MKLEGTAGTITIKIEIDSIGHSGDNLIIRGKFLEMPTVIRITPQEFWAGRRLITFRLLRNLPAFIWRGWRRHCART